MTAAWVKIGRGLHTAPKFPATCLPDIFPLRAQHPVTRIPLRRPSSPIAGPPGAVFPRLAALICCQIRAIFPELHCWFSRDAVASTTTDLHPLLLPVAWLQVSRFPVSRGVSPLQVRRLLCVLFPGRNPGTLRIFSCVRRSVCDFHRNPAGPFPVKTLDRVSRQG